MSDYHAFVAAHRRAADADIEAARNYLRLARQTGDLGMAVDYIERAGECRRGAQRNREAVRARLNGGRS